MSMSRPARKLFEQRKELIERYVRLAVRRRMGRMALALARAFSRPKLKWSDRERNKVLVGALQTLAAKSVRARRSGLDATVVVLNLGLFFLIAERDIQAVKIDALTHQDSWQRNLAARIILLTIHELDIDKAAGAKLRRVLDENQVPEGLKKEVIDSMRSVRKAQSKAQGQFSYLRNSTIAHRDGDAIRQYRDIVEIDSVEVMKVVVEFYKGSESFIRALPRLLAHLGSLPGVVRQIAAKNK